jgi:hypothetical protein
MSAQVRAGSGSLVKAESVRNGAEGLQTPTSLRVRIPNLSALLGRCTWLLLALR